MVMQNTNWRSSRHGQWNTHTTWFGIQDHTLHILRQIPLFFDEKNQCQQGQKLRPKCADGGIRSNLMQLRAMVHESPKSSNGGCRGYHGGCGGCGDIIKQNKKIAKQL